MVFLFILFLMLLIILTLKIRIEIDKLIFNSKPKSNYLNDNYNIKIKFKILNILPIYWININKDKIEIIKQKSRLKKNDFKKKYKKIKKDMDFKQLKEMIKQINIKIKKFYLKAQIGTDDIIFTSLIIPLISTLIAIIMFKKEVKTKTLFYKINPIYNKRKYIKN